jgi:CTP synthase (UTP-ammonia lyase)
MTGRIALLIDSPPGHANRDRSDAAIGHAAAAIEGDVELVPVHTSTLADRRLDDYQGVFVGPGSPYQDPGTVIDWIRDARECGVPLVGT